MKLFTLPPPDISTLNVAVTCKTRVSLFFLQDEAIYFVAGTDDDGDPLMANQEYEVVLVATTRLPARWWSITAYGKDHFLIKNRLNKFSVNVRNVESGCGGAGAGAGAGVGVGVGVGVDVGPETTEGWRFVFTYRDVAADGIEPTETILPMGEKQNERVFLTLRLYQPDTVLRTREGIQAAVLPSIRKLGRGGASSRL